MGIGGKKSVSSDDSSQGSKTYKDQNVKSGATVSFDGVTYTVPTEYSNSEAKIIVSKSGM